MLCKNNLLIHRYLCFCTTTMPPEALSWAVSSRMVKDFHFSWIQNRLLKMSCKGFWQPFLCCLSNQKRILEMKFWNWSTDIINKTGVQFIFEISHKLFHVSYPESYMDNTWWLSSGPISCSRRQSVHSAPSFILHGEVSCVFLCGSWSHGHRPNSMKCGFEASGTAAWLSLPVLHLQTLGDPVHDQTSPMCTTRGWQWMVTGCTQTPTMLCLQWRRCHRDTAPPSLHRRSTRALGPP